MIDDSLQQSLIDKLEALRPNADSPELSERAYRQAVDDCIKIVELHWHAYVPQVASREIPYIEIESALIRHFSEQVTKEFPNATTVPSYEHWRQKANPIIKALRPYLATREPVSVDLQKCANAAYDILHGAISPNVPAGNTWVSVAKAVLDAAGVSYVN